MLNVSFRVIRLGTDAALFERTLHHVLREEWTDIHKHALNWPFQIASTKLPHQNTSLAVFEDDEPVAVSFSIRTDKALGYFGQDVMVLHKPDHKKQGAATDHLLLEYLDIVGEQGIARFDFSIGSNESNQLLQSELSLLNLGAFCMPRYYGVIDLTQPLETLKQDLRKSYKSLINYGRRELQISAETGTDANRAHFEDYQVLHERMAGRVTRPQASWEIMYQMIKAGSAEIIYGYHDGELVGASYFPHSAGTTIYGSGAYDRSKFSKPLAHWPIYCEIERAKARGDYAFNLGEVYLHGVKDRKENNIAYFKKGFTSRVFKCRRWSLRYEK